MTTHNADKIIAGLNEAILFTKQMRFSVIRGYEQAMEELSRQGDYEGKDWSEPYKFLQGRLEALRAEKKS